MNIFNNLLEIVFPRKFPLSDIYKTPQAPQPKDSWIFSLYDYHSQKGKELVYAFKKYKDRALAKKLSFLFHDYIMDYLSDQNQLSYFMNPLVIPVPVSKQRLRERGFNQTHLLAKSFAGRIHAQYRENIIYKTKNTKKQALIKNREERFENIKNAFDIYKKSENIIQGKDVIIIDDLTTTGATLQEIKKLLERKGSRNVIAVTIAH